MFTLLKSEYLRYQKWAWLWAVLLICVLIYIGKQRPLLEVNSSLSALNNLLIIGGSFLFGLLQMALHKRKNHWTYLIHRPLKSTQIIMALMLAGLGIVFIATTLPWMLAVLTIDLFGTSVVDVRHYSYLAFLLLSCLMVYQIGTLMVLNASWGIVLLAVMVVVVLAPSAESLFAQFFPLVCFNLALFYLNLKSFKPDLSTYLKQPAAIALLSVPMSFSLVLGLLMSTMVFYHIPKQIAGTHPDNNPEYGTLRYASQYESNDKLEYYLENVDTLEAKQLVAQAKLADTYWFSASSERFPIKGQLHVDDLKNSITDKKSNTVWQFSHDKMLFVGHNSITKARAGFVGQGGFFDELAEVPNDSRFAEVPLILSNQHFMTSKGLYRLKLDEKTLQTRYKLADDETFVGPAIGTEHVSVRTNKRTLVFDGNNYADEFADLEPLLTFPNIYAENTRRGVEAFELANGFALVFASTDLYGFQQPGVQVYMASYDGDFRLVGERQFEKHRHPAFIRHFEYMMSPSLNYARAAIFHWISPEMKALYYVLNIGWDEYDSTVNMIAFVLYLFSIIAVFVLCRFHKLTYAQTITWVLLVGIMSFPALISFFLLNPFRGVYFNRPEPSPSNTVNA